VKGDKNILNIFSCLLFQVNYVSAHDNETLFDIVSLKVIRYGQYSQHSILHMQFFFLGIWYKFIIYFQTPMDISVAERCRINHLATSVIALSQVKCSPLKSRDFVFLLFILILCWRLQ